MTGSSKTRSTLQVGSRSYDYWSFATLPADKVARLPFSLKILLENLLRFEDGVNVTARRHRGGARLGRQGHALLRNRFHARARHHAGLHRRALRGGPRRHARSRAEARRRSRSSINPLNPAELVIDHSVQVDDYGQRQLARHQQPHRIRAQWRALRVPALGPDRVPQFQGGAAEHRHRSPGQSRIPRPRRVPQDTEGKNDGLSGHGGRHRFAHHHDQRPGRARLGRGRHRSGSRDAGPARDHAHSAGHRLQDDRRDEARLHRHRPRAHRHRDAAQERRGRQVRRVLRRWPREPAARRSRHHRQHGAGVRQHLRHLPDRRRNAALSRVVRPPARADRAGRGVCQGAGHVARQRRQAGRLHRRARARPRHRRAQPRGPEAPAGSRAAVEGEERLPGRAQGHGRRAQEEIARRHRLRGNPARTASRWRSATAR